MVYRGLLRREDLYNPRNVKLYKPFNEVIEEIKKYPKGTMLNAHFYGYLYHGGDPGILRIIPLQRKVN